MPKHYRPPGKKKEGNAAKYITRSKAVKFLQTTLSNFRRLCILKGIFPREPKKKNEGRHKTYYHMKDIMYLAHEPLHDKFREIRAYEKKIKKADAKKNPDLADRLSRNRPKYNLDRLIKERYPNFIDALRDLDDCLTMVHLFATLPATESEQFDAKRIHNCRRLSHEWQAYISRTHSLRKTFISVKGIYYQVEVEGQSMTWLTPHALQQVLTDDVDYKVLLTFLEFYETLLTFVNYKLYHSLNIKYPPILDPRLEALAEDLYALSRYVSASSRIAMLNEAESTLYSGAMQLEKDETENGAHESQLRLALLQNQLAANGPGVLQHLLEDAAMEEEGDDCGDDKKECRNLFKNLVFFLGREVPRESLLFIIPAFGGIISWEGEASPLREQDERITHQIVDRCTQGHIFLCRDYIQPQWVYDCINSRLILPTDGYLVGRVPPPHLSPFVDNEVEGYIPEYAEMIKRLQAAKRQHVLPIPGTEKQDIYDPNNLLIEGIVNRSEDCEAAHKKKEMSMLESQYHQELKMELQGTTYSAALFAKNTQASSAVVDAYQSKFSEPDQVSEDLSKLDEVMMSRKNRKLREAMKIGKERRRAKIDLLEQRKRKAKDAGKQ